MPPTRLILKNVREYNFASQNVTPGYQVDSVVLTARALLGLHSARMQTPFVTAQARVKSFVPADLQHATYGSKQMLKLRCMRATLHTVPLDIAPIVHQATLKFRLAECDRRYGKLSINLSTVQTLQDLIKMYLEEKPKSSRNIESDLEHARSRMKNFHVDFKHIIRAVLKEMWERGTLCYLNQSSSWLKEERKYGITKLCYPELDLDAIEEIDAQRKLVFSYIDAYGPVTKSDIQWWTGLPGRIVTQCLEECIKQIKLVSLSEFSEPCFMSERSLDNFLTHSSTQERWICCLAYEDPSLKAYFTTRSRYVDTSMYARLFNDIGEARPAIIKNGRVVGIWNWDVKSQQAVARFHTLDTAAEIASMKAALARVTRCFS